MLPNPAIGAAAGIALQKPRLATASQCPMQHEVLSGDRQHDLTAPRNPRLESYPVARLQCRPHREALRHELERTRSQGRAEQLHKLRPGHPPGGHPAI